MATPRSTEAGPPGFWAVPINRAPKTGFIIQRLTEELRRRRGAGQRLLGTRRYYSLNQAHVYKKALAHLKNLLKQVASTGRAAAGGASPAPYSNMLVSRFPNLGPMHRLRVQIADASFSSRRMASV